MDDVQGRLGAAWIDADTHQEFLREILDDPTLVVEHPGAAMWGVKGINRSVAANNEWGTDRMPAPAIAKAVLEQRPVQVTDEIDDGRRVVNAGETAAAVEKAEALQERFGEWIWEDPDRGARLLAEYNRRFNALVLRDYTAEGERLTLPGLAATFTPRPHQRAAVARMLNEPAVGLFHQVGAGKTAEMVMGCMELQAAGHGQQARRRRAQPHARAVRPRVAAAVPAGPAAGGLQRRPRRRQAPRVRRARRDQRLGRRPDDPLGV